MTTYIPRTALQGVNPGQAIDAQVSNPRVFTVAGSVDALHKVQRALSTMTMAGPLPNLLWSASTRILTISGSPLVLRYTVFGPDEGTEPAYSVTFLTGQYSFGPTSIMLVPIGLGEGGIIVGPPGSIVSGPEGAQVHYALNDPQAQSILAATMATDADAALALFQFARVTGNHLSLFNRQVLRNNIPVVDGYEDAQYANRADLAAIWRAVNQDRSLVITGGGDVQFSHVPLATTAAVVFASDLRIYLPSGITLDVPATGALTLSTTANVISVVLSRTDGSTTTGALSVSNLASVSSSSDNAVLILAIWRVDEDRLYWVNGNVHRSGDIFPIGLSGRIPFIEAAEGIAGVSQFATAELADEALDSGHTRVVWLVDETSFEDADPDTVGAQPLIAFTPVTRTSLDQRDTVDVPWEALHVHAFWGERLIHSGTALRVWSYPDLVPGTLAAANLWATTLAPGTSDGEVITVRAQDGDDLVTLDVRHVRLDTLRARDGADAVEVRRHDGLTLTRLRAGSVRTDVLVADTAQEIAVTDAAGDPAGFDVEYVRVAEMRTQESSVSSNVEVKNLSGAALAGLSARSLNASTQVSSPLFTGTTGWFGQVIATYTLTNSIQAGTGLDVLNFFTYGGLDTTWTPIGVHSLMLRTGSPTGQIGLYGGGTITFVEMDSSGAGTGTLLGLRADMMELDSHLKTDDIQVRTTGGDLEIRSVTGAFLANVKASGFRSSGNTVVDSSSIRVPSGATRPAHVRVTDFAGAPAHVDSLTSVRAAVTFLGGGFSTVENGGTYTSPDGDTYSARVPVKGLNLADAYAYIGSDAIYVYLDTDLSEADLTYVVAVGVFRLSQDPLARGVFTVSEATTNTAGAFRKVRLKVMCTGVPDTNRIGSFGNILDDMEAIPTDSGTLDLYTDTAVRLIGSLALFSTTTT